MPGFDEIMALARELERPEPRGICVFPGPADRFLAELRKAGVFGELAPGVPFDPLAGLEVREIEHFGKAVTVVGEGRLLDEILAGPVGRARVLRAAGIL